MGARGPAKRPAPLLLLSGKAPGKDSAGRPVAIPPPFTRRAPVMPEYLSPYAREIWEQTEPTLVRLGLTKPEDMASLAAYCESVDLWRDAYLDVQRRGQILEVVKEGQRWVDPSSPEFDRERSARQGEPGDGYFVPCPVIERKINPSVTAVNTHALRMLRFAQQFGLTPSSEQSVGQAGSGRGTLTPGESNPFAGMDSVTG